MEWHRGRWLRGIRIGRIWRGEQKRLGEGQGRRGTKVVGAEKGGKEGLAWLTGGCQKRRTKKHGAQEFTHAELIHWNQPQNELTSGRGTENPILLKSHIPLPH